MISVLVVVGNIPIRVIVGYGPQENALVEKKQKFWSFLEEEINQAEIEGQGVLLQMDGNLHAGSALVKGDPNVQNKNGKLFMDFLERNPSITVVNALFMCEGLITRRRVFENRTEEAVLDFFAVNEKLRPFVQRMIIDEGKNYCLGNYLQMKKNKRLLKLIT